MTLTLELPANVEAMLSAEADKRGVPLPDYALQVLEQSVTLEEADAELTTGEYILQLAKKFHDSIPPEEWAKIPTDLAINHDHYLYGAPKVEEGSPYSLIRATGLRS